MNDVINNNPVIIYQDEKQSIKIKLEDESIWLNQAQIESLFQTSHSNLLEHIKNIYNTGELKEGATCRYFRQVQIDKVDVEYKKYKQKTLTQVERDFLEEIKRIGEIAKGGEKGSD